MLKSQEAAAEAVATNIRQAYQNNDGGIVFINGDFTDTCEVIECVVDQSGTTTNLTWMRQYANCVKMCEPIDMDYFMNERSFMASLLVRLSALHQIDTRTVFDQRGSSVFGEFAQLEQNIIHSRNGISPAYRDTLDPAFAASEVLTAEAIAIGVVERFKNAITMLRKYLSECNPVLIIPVLNVDCNPTQATEVLQVLKQYSVPGIVYLVTGNLQLVTNFVELQTTGSLPQQSELSTQVGSRVAKHKVQSVLSKSTIINVQTKES